MTNYKMEEELTRAIAASLRKQGLKNMEVSETSLSDLSKRTIIYSVIIKVR